MFADKEIIVNKHTHPEYKGLFTEKDWEKLAEGIREDREERYAVYEK